MPRARLREGGPSTQNDVRLSDGALFVAVVDAEEGSGFTQDRDPGRGQTYGRDHDELERGVSRLGLFDQDIPQSMKSGREDEETRSKHNKKGLTPHMDIRPQLDQSIEKLRKKLSSAPAWQSRRTFCARRARRNGTAEVLDAREDLWPSWRRARQRPSLRFQATK